MTPVATKWPEAEGLTEAKNKYVCQGVLKEAVTHYFTHRSDRRLEHLDSAYTVYLEKVSD